jgi:hypothetical protein
MSVGRTQQYICVTGIHTPQHVITIAQLFTTAAAAAAAVAAAAAACCNSNLAVLSM